MKSSKNDVKSSGYIYLSIAVVSVFALGATFALSSSRMAFSHKLALFSLLVALYLLSFAVVYLASGKREAEPAAAGEASENPFTAEIDEKLQILEQASEFFAASLRPADMFRLIAGRIGDITPFAACALFLVNEQKTHLMISQATGRNAALLKNLNILISEGLAGRVYRSRLPAVDERLSDDRKVFSRATLSELGSAAAVPLIRAGGEVFGVLELFGATQRAFDKTHLALLEAIGERIVPLLNGSFSFERNVSSAMTDALTSLPNERAFYLVLENQIAEAQRLPEKRNLAVLVMDIRNFDEINKTYGHAVGDKILAFTAQTVKSQLRQMDFLSRSINDEFFAVLPTADRDIAERIVRRIEQKFAGAPFRFSGQSISVRLNFGFASFNTEGETANQLLRAALHKKLRSKSSADGNVLWFPKEFVN